MLEHLHGTTVYIADREVATDRDAVDVIAAAHYDHGADFLVLPVDQLPADFFRLKSGVAGAIVQKFVDYRMRLAVMGDVESHAAASTSFRDWVREANRGRQLWFVADLADLSERLAAQQ
jgi:hypothetical protein